jgi:hypothetical protein
MEGKGNVCDECANDGNPLDMISFTDNVQRREQAFKMTDKWRIPTFEWQSGPLTE